MIAAVIALAIGGFGFAATAVALAIRQSGIRERAARLELTLADTQDQLAGTADELIVTRTAMAAENAELRERLNQLRDRIYALPDTAGNRDVVLSELDRLLQGETPADDRDDDHGS